MKILLLAVAFVVLATAIWWVPEVVLWDCDQIAPTTTLNDCEDANTGIGGLLRGLFAIAAFVAGVLLAMQIVGTVKLRN